MKKVVALLLGFVLLLGSVVSLAEPPASMTPPGELPIVTETETLVIGVRQDASVMDLNENQFSLWLEEMTGINLEFVPFTGSTSERSEKFNLMVAANQTLPDVLLDFWQFDGTIQQTYANAGVFLPLEDLIEEYGYFYKEALATLSVYDQERVATSGILADGHQYGMVDYDARTNKMMGLAWYINQKWLDTLGLSAPSTTEELYQVLKAFVENDPNGNGIQDEIGLIGGNFNMSYPTTMIANSFVYFYDTNRCNLDDSGMIYAAYATEEFREALRYMNRLVAEGLMSDQVFTIHETEAVKTMMNPGEGEPQIIGVVCGNTGQCIGGTDVLYDYEPIGPIEGPGGYRWTTLTDVQLNYDSFITKDCKSPELAMRFMDFFYRHDTYAHSLYGVEGEQWRFAEEGELTVTGNQGTYVVMEPKPSPNDAQWSVVQPMSFAPLYYMQNTIPSSTNPYNQRSDELYTKYIELVQGTMPESRIGTLTYTEEEADQINVIINELKTYVDECIALFCTGAMDIEADWDAYLQMLDNIGLQEMLTVMQAAYDR